jgi:hypothetical protein
MAAESRLLDLLDSWRDLPAYQLERRADIFFAAYLPRFLSDRFGCAVSERLIPEFPLHHRTMRPLVPRKGDDSCRLDYLALDVDLSNAYFVELKTDAGSRGLEQEQNMTAAKEAGLPALVAGVLKIVKASTQKRKYACILRLMAANKLLALPEDFDEMVARKRYQSAINQCLPRMRISEVKPEIRILYLQPRATGEGDIGFADFAAWLCSQPGDDLAARFAVSLGRWAAAPAGG